MSSAEYEPSPAEIDEEIECFSDAAHREACFSGKGIACGLAHIRGEAALEIERERISRWLVRIYRAKHDTD
jgi:hypothetical protein